MFPFQREEPKSKAEELAFRIVNQVDEMVGHQRIVPETELLQELYPKLEILLGEWTEKIDKVKLVHSSPRWLLEYATMREKDEGRPVMDIDSTNLGFKVENAFIGEKCEGLTDDGILVSEPKTMRKEDFANLVDFCDRNGLSFYVDGFSRRLPLHTFRVAIFRPLGEHGELSDVEFREKAIFVLENYKRIVGERKKEGTDIQDDEIVNELIKTGKMDEPMANQILRALRKARMIAE